MSGWFIVKGGITSKNKEIETQIGDNNLFVVLLYFFYMAFLLFLKCEIINRKQENTLYIKRLISFVNHRPLVSLEVDHKVEAFSNKNISRRGIR